MDKFADRLASQQDAGQSTPMEYTRERRKEKKSPDMKPPRLLTASAVYFLCVIIAVYLITK